MSVEQKKPVTLITGYLGSGKTTVMNELLKNQTSKKIAVIVNDMGAVNIDANLIKQDGMVAYETELVELQNGCICCTLRDEFMAQIESLSKSDSMDAILVEASGISNPSSIADAFVMYEEENEDTSVYLDSIVTVVDADRIYYEFLDRLQENIEEAAATTEEEEEDPDIINLVMDQIEFCNVVILNKCDLLTQTQLMEVKNVLKSLQPEAEIIETQYGKVDPDKIFHNAKFDYDKVNESSLMGRTLSGKLKEEKDHDEYGISSFVYEERRPFDYDKFIAFMENEYPESLIRAKGYIWFADDDIHVQLFEQAGRNSSLAEMSNWVASFTKEEQQKVFDEYPDVLADWDETYGDRLNQIVFIGKDYKKEDIIAGLNRCLAK